MKDFGWLCAKILNSEHHKREGLVPSFDNKFFPTDINLDAEEIAEKFAIRAAEAELEVTRLERVEQAAINATTMAREVAAGTAYIARISGHPEWQHTHIPN